MLDNKLIAYNAASFFEKLESNGYNVTNSKILDAVKNKTQWSHSLKGKEYSVSELDISLSPAEFKSLCRNVGEDLVLIPTKFYTKLVLTGINQLITLHELFLQLKKNFPGLTGLSLISEEPDDTQLVLANFISFQEAKAALNQLNQDNTALSLSKDSFSAVWSVPSFEIENYLFNSSKELLIKNTLPFVDPLKLKTKLESIGKVESIRKYASKTVIRFNSPLARQIVEFEDSEVELIPLFKTETRTEKYRLPKKIAVPQQLSVENRKRVASVFTDNSSYLLEALKVKTENILERLKKKEQRHKREKSYTNHKRHREDSQDRREERRDNYRRDDYRQRDSYRRDDYRREDRREERRDSGSSTQSEALKIIELLLKKKQEENRSEIKVEQLYELLKQKKEPEYKNPSYSVPQNYPSQPSVVNPNTLSLADQNTLQAYLKLSQSYDKQPYTQPREYENARTPQFDANKGVYDSSRNPPYSSNQYDSTRNPPYDSNPYESQPNQANPQFYNPYNLPKYPEQPDSKGYYYNPYLNNNK